MAAVIGRTFLYRVLAAIAEKTPELEGHLLTLQREEMIRERARIPEPEYIFKHELTREATYDGLLRRERLRLHREVAEVLERLFPERLEEQAGLLAHHWERAGESGRAIEYLQRAGDRARALYAHEESTDFYGRALALLKDQGDLEQAARTLMKLGLTHHNAFDFRAARQAYEEGFVLWQRAGEAQPATSRAPAPHALRVALGGDPLSLDPACCIDDASGRVIVQLFSGLVALSPEMSVVPDVAQTWEVLDSGRQYVFHLRDDARWSDGIPVTAHDFEFAWKRVLDPASGASAPDYLYDVRGARAYHQREVHDPDQVAIRALGELTLVVELEAPASYFPLLLTSMTTFPVPRHTVPALGSAWTHAESIVTNGPFKLAAWERGVSMALERNPAYHGRFDGNLERVLMSLDTQDPGRWLRLYEDDGLELLSLADLSPAEQERARQRYAGECISTAGLMTHYAGFNVRQPPFDDRRVRRALALATDRELLADEVHRGHGLPASGGLLPPGMPGHVPGIGLPYDPERARHLLAEAGHPGGRGLPAVECLVCRDSVFHVLTGEFLRAEWGKLLGLELMCTMMSWASLLDRLDGATPPMWLMGWLGDYPDPDNFLRTATWRAECGWQNKAYDRLVEDARRVMDQEQRVRLYQQADRILMEEVPIIPLTHVRGQVLAKPWVRRFPAEPFGGLSWKDVIIEPH